LSLGANYNLSPEFKKWFSQQIRYAFDPQAWAWEMLRFECDTWQKQALNDLINKRFCAWAAGTGVGKSALLAVIILWFLSTRPFPRVPCTAPTQHQLFDILWAEIAKWLRRNEMLAKLFSWTQTKVCLKAHPEEWYAVARTSRPKPGEESAEGLQGFHEDNILYVIDEGSAVPDAVYNAVDGAFTTEGAYAIVASNPTRRTGYFYDIFNSPKHAGLWALRNVDANTARAVIPTSIQRVIQIYGKDSDYYRIKVAGVFPLSDATSLFSDEMLNAAHDRELVSTNEVTVMSCDPARFGDDYTVFYVRKGRRIIDRHQLKSLDTVEVALFGLELFKRYTPAAYVIDSIGIGAGVIDTTIHELRKPENGKGKDVGKIIDVAVNGAPVNEEMFVNIRAEMYWHLSQIMDFVSIEIETILLDEELPKIKYFMAKNESLIQIEPKKDLKAILGRSPNDADALALSFYTEVKQGLKISTDAMKAGMVSSPILSALKADTLVLENAEGSEGLTDSGRVGIGRYAAVTSSSGYLTGSSRGSGWMRGV
jgi:hypothetical protein